MSDNVTDPLKVQQEAEAKLAAAAKRTLARATKKLRATNLPASPQTAAGGTSEGPQGLSPEELHLAIVADFKVFLTLLWLYLKLGVPSAVQLSVADYLQHGPSNVVIMAFRGCGKSWICAAYAIWTLYCNPQAKVLVVSGSMKRSIQFTTFCLALVRDMPLLQHLMPTRDQRQSATSFDVGPARPAQSSSLSAFGITGQIVGQRADLIVPDDVETNTNSVTKMMREKLADAVREFSAILVPGGKVKFLGTPQNNDSLYNKLGNRGYAIRIWPQVFPDEKQLKRYGDSLSPYIRNRSEGHAGEPTWPERFSAGEVAKQRMQWGSSGYALQFMLDTSLSDTNRYPLKLGNLIVMGLSKDKGPDDVNWGMGDDLIIHGLPDVGFQGDRYYKPASVGASYSPYNSIMAAIDPSDKGNDEAAMVIGAELNARVFMLKSKGWLDGTSPKTLREMAKLLVEYRVGVCRIESNFGGSMFGQLLKPYVVEEWARWNKANPKLFGGTELVDERAVRTQKEMRIINDMEPATEGHRIVVSQQLIEDDYTEVMARDEGDTTDRYSLLYQYTNLTRERDALTHDDRLDAMAAVVAHYRDILGINPDTLAAIKHEETLEEELERLFNETDEVQGLSTKANRLSHRHTNGRVRAGH